VGSCRAAHPGSVWAWPVGSGLPINAAGVVTCGSAHCGSGRSQAGKNYALCWCAPDGWRDSDLGNCGPCWLLLMYVLCSKVKNNGDEALTFSNIVTKCLHRTLGRVALPLHLRGTRWTVLGGLGCALRAQRPLQVAGQRGRQYQRPSRLRFYSWRTSTVASACLPSDANWNGETYRCQARGPPQESLLSKALQ